MLDVNATPEDTLLICRDLQLAMMEISIAMPTTSIDALNMIYLKETSTQWLKRSTTVMDQMVYGKDVMEVGVGKTYTL